MYKQIVVEAQALGQVLLHLQLFVQLMLLLIQKILMQQWVVFLTVGLVLVRQVRIGNLMTLQPLVIVILIILPEVVILHLLTLRHLPLLQTLRCSHR